MHVWSCSGTPRGICSQHTHTHTHTSLPHPAQNLELHSFTVPASHFQSPTFPPPAPNLQPHSFPVPASHSSRTVPATRTNAHPGLCRDCLGNWFRAHPHTQSSSLTVSQSQPQTPASQFQPHTHKCTSGIVPGLSGVYIYLCPGFTRDSLGCASVLFPGFSGVHILKSANDHPGLSGITLVNYIKHMTMRIRDCAGTVRGVHIFLSGIYPGFSGVCIRLFSGILWGAHP